jgi:CRP-like cAMP-binding protein
MNSFFDILEKLPNLPDDQRKLLEESVKVIKVKKGEVIQQRGDLVRKGYLVKKGLLRSYSVDAKGKEHIYIFAPEGWIAGGLEFDSENLRTELFIDALEDSEVEMANSNLFNHYLSFLDEEALKVEISRLIRRVSVLQNRVISLMSSTATERYEEFLKTYPQIVQRVPQRMIASYLGITPEALSKLKGELVRK